MKQTTDIEGLVSITLEEAFVGKDVAVNVRRRVSGQEGKYYRLRFAVLYKWGYYGSSYVVAWAASYKINSWIALVLLIGNYEEL